MTIQADSPKFQRLSLRTGTIDSEEKLISFQAIFVLIDIMNFNCQKTFIFKFKNGDKSNVIQSYYC